MSQDLTNIDAVLAGKTKALSEQVSGLCGGDGIQRIRVKNKTFTLPDDDVQIKNNLDVVVLASALSYAYYKEEYVQGSNDFPDCFAVGSNTVEMRPSQNSSDRQAEKCATCPMNQFGSGKGNAKACQNRINLAVQIAEHGPDSNVYVIGVSPTALKGWRKYVAALSERGVHPVQLVTRIGFAEGVAYDRLVFSAKAKVSAEDLPQYVARMDQAEQAILREPTPPSDDD